MFKRFQAFLGSLGLFRLLKAFLGVFPCFKLSQKAATAVGSKFKLSQKARAVLYFLFISLKHHMFQNAVLTARMMNSPLSPLPV